MKTTVEVKVKLTLDLKDGQSTFDAINEMDYNFELDSEYGTLLDSEIVDCQVLSWQTRKMKI